MPEKKAKVVPKKKAAKIEAKTSVKSYQHGIETEKQEMGAYSKKFGSNVRGLQADFKKHARDVKAAAEDIREEGRKHMGDLINKCKGEIKAATKSMDDKVNKLKGDIKDQIKENNEAVSKIKNGIKFFISEINKKKNEFKAYSRAFWGVSEKV